MYVPSFRKKQPPAPVCWVEIRTRKTAGAFFLKKSKSVNEDAAEEIPKKEKPQLSAYFTEKKGGAMMHRFSSPELYKSTKAVARRIFSSKRNTVPEIVDNSL